MGGHFLESFDELDMMRNIRQPGPLGCSGCSVRGNGVSDLTDWAHVDWDLFSLWGILFKDRQKRTGKLMGNFWPRGSPECEGFYPPCDSHTKSLF